MWSSCPIHIAHSHTHQQQHPYRVVPKDHQGHSEHPPAEDFIRGALCSCELALSGQIGPDGYLRSTARESAALLTILAGTDESRRLRCTKTPDVPDHLDLIQTVWPLESATPPELERKFSVKALLYPALNADGAVLFSVT